MAARDIIVESIKVSDIFVMANRRPVSDEAVQALAVSIKGIGIQHPITVRFVHHYVDPVEGELDGAYVLVAGRHRLEAARSLSMEHINCTVVRWDERQSRKWEIAENLHRSDLTELQRKEQIAEWIAIEEAEASDGVSAQVAPKPQGGRPSGGVNAASRELGIERTEAQRAVKIASISEEAKQAIVDANLDENQSVLMKVARAPSDEQVAVVSEIVEARALKTDQDIKNRAAQDVAELFATHIPADVWDMLKASIKTADNVNLILSAFNNLVGNSIMDRRHG